MKTMVITINIVRKNTESNMPAKIPMNAPIMIESLALLALFNKPEIKILSNNGNQLGIH
jgi:hypothetical protein